MERGHASPSSDTHIGHPESRRDDKLAVILLTNHSNSLLDQIVLDLAGKYIPALKKPTESRIPIRKQRLS
jgi:hypothetical protein